MNSGKTQAIWLGNKRQSLTKCLPHIKIDWNPLKFKSVGVWLTADLTDCEEINRNNKFSETKTLYNIWIKRTITPLGKMTILKSLILYTFLQLWMLLPNPPDGFIDGLQPKNMPGSTITIYFLLQICLDDIASKYQYYPINFCMCLV